jgi:tryptophan-rich sensory protein
VAFKATFLATSFLTILFGVIASFDGLGGNSMAVTSDKYHHEYMPDGWVFSVWWVIYTGIALSAYREWRHKQELLHTPLVIVLFAVTLIANITWLFMWAHDQIEGAFVFIVALYCALQVIAHDQKAHAPDSTVRLLTLKVSEGTKHTVIRSSSVFSFYASWIGFATVFNLFAVVRKHEEDDVYFTASAGILLIVMLVVVGVLSLVNRVWHNIVLMAFVSVAITTGRFGDGPAEARPFYVSFIIISVAFGGLAVLVLTSTAVRTFLDSFKRNTDDAGPG